MENLVTIKSANDDTRLTFSYVSGESFTAVLESAHLSGRVIASTYHIGPPSLLFEEMALNWKGWKGEKSWAALEDELRLTATIDLTGHIRLQVTMRDYSCPSDWCLQAAILLEAGQLAGLARATEKVFGQANN